MSTFSDWQARFSRLTDNIIQLDAFAQSSMQNNRSTGELISAVDDLKRRKAVLEAKEKELEQKASTADREFLERKSEFPDPFYPDKIYTLQDFTLFFFFVSYIIFIVAAVLTFREKMGLILGVGFILLLLSFAIIVRYA